MSDELTVYLLRHGETDMNADGNRYSGITDAILTEKGIKQALAAGELLAGKNIAALFASPLQRSRRTAELLGLSLPVVVDERLTEMNFGSWEGKTREEFIAEDPESWRKWNEDPDVNPAGGDGDTAKTVTDRLEDFFNEKFREYRGRNIVVVGHNGINRLYLSRRLGMPARNYRSILQENSCVTRFVLSDEEGFQLQKLNCR